MANEDDGWGFTNTYYGQRLLSHNTYIRVDRQGDSQACPTDPDATPLYAEYGHSRLGYHVQYVVDGGRARIILAALVTPASIMDNTPMLDLARWVRFRWHLRPKIAVGDSKFGTIRNIVALEQDGLRAYLAMPDLNKRSGLYTLDQFRYDAERDVYTCPHGQFLPLSSFDQYQQAFMYRTKRKICNACPVKTKCTTSAYGRVLRRLVVQDYIDRVRAYHGTADYQRTMRKRALWTKHQASPAYQTPLFSSSATQTRGFCTSSGPGLSLYKASIIIVLKIDAIPLSASIHFFNRLL